MRKKVFICSPFRDDMEGKLERRLPTAAWHVRKGDEVWMFGKDIDKRTVFT